MTAGEPPYRGPSAWFAAGLIALVFSSASFVLAAEYLVPCFVNNIASGCPSPADHVVEFFLYLVLVLLVLAVTCFARERHPPNALPKGFEPGETEANGLTVAGIVIALATLVLILLLLYPERRPGRGRSGKATA